MQLAELPVSVRRPLALVHCVIFFGLVFFAGPAEFVRLNEEWGWPRWQGVPWQVAGASLMLLAVAILAYCSGLFARVGLGTPVPWQPPKRLVVTRLYRYSRNPIYVSYAAFLLGEFFFFGHASLLVYLGLYFVVTQAVLVWWEEPVLRERHGEDYVRYTQEVRRWL